MDIKFQEPLYLLLLIPAILLIFWWLKSQKRVLGRKKFLISFIRLLIFVSLIFALARPYLLFPINGETIVFVIDKSASMKEDTRVIEFLEEAIKNKDEEDKYSIVAVGAEALIEQPLTNKNELSSLGVTVNPHGTNLADGIRLASSMIPSNTKGRIILISDGIETDGKALDEVSYAKERGIVVDAYSLQHSIGNEVLISSLQIPSSMYLGEEFEGTIIIDSTTPTTGTLRIFEGNKEVSKQTLSIEKGENRFLFQQQVTQKGFHKFRAELTVANNDTIDVNNQAYAYTQVLDQPKVLIIEGQQNAADNLEKALQAGNIEAETRSPEMLPNELEDYRQYSSIILADVQATDISDIDMKRINTSVRDMGIGLIMTGGYNGFGLGGWYQTPIEEALPVYMDIRNKENVPSLGLILVIDKSGSMAGGAGGYNKMELAKEAALRSTDMLSEKDYVGVVAFDNTPWVVVEPESAKNLSNIQEKISGIYPDGGTDIYPALVEAYNQLKELDTQRKHIILLTDGQSGRDDDYQGLLEEALHNNITVSTVAIGDDADITLLEQIASMGNGRFYSSSDPSTLPKIFSKETALASKSFVMDKPQVPIKAASSEWVVSSSNLPILDSYIATTPKQTSENLLISSDGDPILSRWQYGLGKAVAWTSDIEGKWSSDWVKWDKYSQLWNEIVSWTFPQVSDTNWKTEAYINGLEGTIAVDMAENKLPQEMEAIVINDDLQSETIKLKPTAPGKLEGNFKVDDEGTYLIQVLEKANGNILASQTIGANVSYSPEYGIFSGGEEKLNQLVKQSGGKIITDPNEVYTDTLVINWNTKDVSKYFLLLAAFLWPIDIGLRKVRISFNWLSNLLGKLLNRKKAKTTTTTTENLSTLVEKRKNKNSLKEKRGVEVREIFESKVENNKINPEKTSMNNSKTDEHTKQTDTLNNTQNNTFDQLIKAKNKKRK